MCHFPINWGLAQSWCYNVVAIGSMRARSNSVPARPYIERLGALSRLIWPSVCPLLQGVMIALRMASISLWIDRRHRLPEQGRPLRSFVQGLGRDHADDCRRPQASRCQDRHHLRAAHLGLGHDPSPPRAHDRAGWRHLTRRPALDIVPAGVLPPRARALPPVPSAVPGEASRRTPSRPVELLRQRRPSGRCAILRSLSGTAAQGRVGRLRQATVWRT